jgi:hypothetical protein
MYACPGLGCMVILLLGGEDLVVVIRYGTFFLSLCVTVVMRTCHVALIGLFIERLKSIDIL